MPQRPVQLLGARLFMKGIRLDEMSKEIDTYEHLQHLGMVPNPWNQGNYFEFRPSHGVKGLRPCEDRNCRRSQCMVQKRGLQNYPPPVPNLVQDYSNRLQRLEYQNQDLRRDNKFMQREAEYLSGEMFKQKKQLDEVKYMLQLRNNRRENRNGRRNGSSDWWYDSGNRRDNYGGSSHGGIRGGDSPYFEGDHSEDTWYGGRGRGVWDSSPDRFGGGRREW